MNAVTGLASPNGYTRNAGVVSRTNSELSPYVRATFAAGFVRWQPLMLFGPAITNMQIHFRQGHSLAATNGFTAFPSPGIPRNAAATSKAPMSEAWASQISDGDVPASILANHLDAVGLEAWHLQWAALCLRILILETSSERQGKVERDGEAVILSFSIKAGLLTSICFSSSSFTS